MIPYNFVIHSGRNSCGVSAKELCQDLQRLAARGSLRGAEKRLASQHGTAGDLYTRESGKRETYDVKSVI